MSILQLFSASIEKAPLTVKAKAAEREYGEANPIFELEYSGFQYGDTVNDLLAEPVATVNANASSPVTDSDTKYPITVSGGSAENYRFVYDSTTELTIKPTGSGTLYITGSSNTVRVNDVFTLYAFFGNSKVNATWRLSQDSPSDVVELSKDGTVTAKKYGTVTIIAQTDKNYGEKTAQFVLKVKQTEVTLVPIDLVKTYTGERQDISFAQNPDFTPVLSGEGKNVDISYTLISDPSVTEPIQAGTYSVVYTINDGGCTGGGSTTMYINKATVTAKVKDDSKTYGEVYAAYDIEITGAGGITNEAALEAVRQDIKSAAKFVSKGAVKTAVVNQEGYEITPMLSETETTNVRFTVDKGTLTVNKAPLTVKIQNVTRKYGDENPTKISYTIEGFKNGQTEADLTGAITPVYAESIQEKIGTQKNVITVLSTLDNSNYTISIQYPEGNGADLTITKIPVKASAEPSSELYLKVTFDRVVEGVSFAVSQGTEPVKITDVTSSDNKTYTLSGRFTIGTAYTVEIRYENETQEITNPTLTVTPSIKWQNPFGDVKESKWYYDYVKYVNQCGLMLGISDTEFCPEETLTRGMFVVVLYRAAGEPEVAKSASFTDVDPERYYADAIAWAEQNQIVNGFSKTEFAPDENITREQVSTIIYRYAQYKGIAGDAPEIELDYKDADEIMKYALAGVKYCTLNGIMQGDENHMFAPGRNATRAECAAILNRFLEGNR